jgi:hypothetical protein
MDDKKKEFGELGCVSFNRFAERGANVPAFHPSSQPRERFAE